MAEEVRMEFIDQGFRALLQSSGIRGEVQRVAQGICDRAGEGHYCEVMIGRSYNAERWLGFVGCKTHEAMRRQATEKTLSQAVMGQ